MECCPVLEHKIRYRCCTMAKFPWLHDPDFCPFLIWNLFFLKPRPTDMAADQLKSGMLLCSRKETWVILLPRRWKATRCDQTCLAQRNCTLRGKHRIQQSLGLLSSSKLHKKSIERCGDGWKQQHYLPEWKIHQKCWPLVLSSFHWRSALRWACVHQLWKSSVPFKRCWGENLVWWGSEKLAQLWQQWQGVCRRLCSSSVTWKMGKQQSTRSM